MAVFAYRARASDGRRVDGRLEGPSRAAVVGELQARGLAPVQVREAAAARSGRRLPERRLAAVYAQLADLLKAGVPLLRALRLMGRGRADARVAAAMNTIAEQVAEGERLADAMRSVGGFPDIHVAMVQAGERGGFLDDVLAELGAFLEHQADRRSTVLGNLIYPAMLVLIGLGIVVIALVYFVPKFESVFEGMEMPLATRILLGTSAFATTWWPLGVLSAAALGGGWLAVRRRPDVRRKIADWQLRLPIAGELVRSLAVARFTRILGTLLDNGIPMLVALRISRDATGHPLLAEAVDAAADAVGGGESLSTPLERSGLFGEDVIEMIGVGEAANTLPTVLVGVARTAEKRTDRVLGMLLKLMEPAILLALAGAVVFIFLALVVPMMELGSEL
jgi:type II secretory pathway component PulF